MVPEEKEPSSASTLWSRSSKFFQVTVSPFLMVILLGVKARFWMRMSSRASRWAKSKAGAAAKSRIAIESASLDRIFISRGGGAAPSYMTRQKNIGYCGQPRRLYRVGRPRHFEI